MGITEAERSAFNRQKRFYGMCGVVIASQARGEFLSLDEDNANWCRMYLEYQHDIDQETMRQSCARTGHCYDSILDHMLGAAEGASAKAARALVLAETA